MNTKYKLFYSFTYNDSRNDTAIVNQLFDRPIDAYVYVEKKFGKDFDCFYMLQVFVHD